MTNSLFQAVVLGFVTLALVPPGIAQIGSTTINLTNVPASDLSPSWSPDGLQIAFRSDRHEQSDPGLPTDEIYIMDADGNNVTRLTFNDVDDAEPAWSPDGGSIAFWSDRDGRAEIYLMDADGGNQRRLTFDQVGDNRECAWSPDGTRLAFASNRTGQWQIFTMNRDGTDQRPLTADGSSGRFPAWSPNGNEIAYMGRLDNQWEILTVPAEGGLPENISNHPDDDTYPTWSPDGAWLAFSSTRDALDRLVSSDAPGDLWMLHRRSGDVHRVTRNPAFEDLPAWSPDGRRLAFRSSQDWDRGGYEIFVIDIALPSLVAPASWGQVKFSRGTAF